MRLSLSWLGVFIILTATIYFSWKGYIIYESFNSPTQFEGFTQAITDDIVLQTCPINTKQYINTSGLSVCCDGSVATGICHGTDVCSLSEAGELPTCGRYLAAILDQKGYNVCPPSMPNYYEGAKKGCTAGRRKTDGTGPANSADKSCVLYPTEQEELGNIDSCTNAKMMDNTQCFSGSDNVAYNVKKQLVSNNYERDGKVALYIPATILCSFGNINTATAGTCVADSSLDRMMDYFVSKFGVFKGWRANTASWDPINKLNYCSIRQKYSIDKTIAFADLQTIEVS